MPKITMFVPIFLLKAVLKNVSKIGIYEVYLSDFRNESNGIFVLGVGFFFRQISTS